jgi:hypothetical protein
MLYFMQANLVIQAVVAIVVIGFAAVEALSVRN